MDLRVDFRAPDAPRVFTEMLHASGFVALEHHGISPDLVDTVYDEWAHFFDRGDKERYLFDPEKKWGYYPYLAENAKDREVKDLKEFYHVYERTPLPDGVSEATRGLYAELVALAETLLEWLDASSPDSVRARFSMPLGEMIEGSRRTLFRILHYPPLTDDRDPSALRAAPHEDINLLTLLPAGTAPGLEVRDAAGTWHAVACDPSAIIVNSGDMLAMASGGYFASTTHRVVNPGEGSERTSRYSMPLFLHPRPEVRLSERYTADEYLTERLREIGLL